MKFIGFLIGILVLALSLLIIIYQEDVIRYFVVKSLRLVPNTDLYNEWINPKFTVYMKFYLYNIKNAYDFETKGAKPLLEEIGPFVYKEHRLKENITHNDNYTISYKQRRIFEFIPELSAYNESFPITTLNIVTVNIINNLQANPQQSIWLLNLAFGMSDAKLTINKTAGQILWGYDDTLLSLMGSLLPNKVKSNKVGLMDGKNNTIEGWYTIFTGADDISKLGLIHSFNYKTSLSNWDSQYANMINGTHGPFPQPFVDRYSRRYSFSSDICRSMYTVYNSSVKIKHNIDLWKFSGSEYMHANVSVNSENADFCVPSGDCKLGAGVINMTGCYKKDNISLPILLSNPHFLFGDEKYRQAYDGVSTPDPAKHHSEVYLEPLTGVPMKANARVQFNANCINDSRINIAKHVRSLVFPLMWLDEGFEMDDLFIHNFYYKVLFPVFILNISKYGLFIGGYLIITLATVFLLISFNLKYNRVGDKENE